MPSGRSVYAAKAMSWIVFACSGAPLTKKRSRSHSRSSGAPRAGVRRSSCAFSRSLRATTAVAAPAVGVERLAYVPSPYGVLSVSPSCTIDVLGRDAELVRDDLRERRLVPLALGLDAELEDRLTGRMHAQLGRVEHLDAEDVVLPAGPAPTTSVKDAMPMPISLPSSRAAACSSRSSA